MHVDRLSLRNFRNYAHAEIDLEPGVRVFEGANGQGKTNLVEAIGYLSSLRSHRVSTDTALVRQGCDQATISARLVSGRRRLELTVDIARTGANRVRAGGHPVKARELPRYITSVLFAPEDLALVRGDPAVRRGFFDDLLLTHSPRLGEVLSGYERVVRQRNALLRQHRGRGLDAAAGANLDIWDERLVEFGTRIIVERLALAERLTPHLHAAYAALVGADHAPEIRMQVTALEDARQAMSEDAGVTPHESALTPEDVADRFAQRVALGRERDVERGMTLVGPHRDDAIFRLNGLPARVTASHGESWSFALSLKLAAAELVRAESRTGDPVLILDDVFAELDARRRSRLAAAIGDFEQVLITCAVLDDIPAAMRIRTTRIEAGHIRDGDASDGESREKEADDGGSV